MRTFIIGLIILILAAGASTPWLINRGHTLEANEMHWGTVIRPFSLQTPAVGAAAYDWKANVQQQLDYAKTLGLKTIRFDLESNSGLMKTMLQMTKDAGFETVVVVDQADNNYTSTTTDFTALGTKLGHQVTTDYPGLIDVYQLANEVTGSAVHQSTDIGATLPNNYGLSFDKTRYTNVMHYTKAMGLAIHSAQPSAKLMLTGHWVLTDIFPMLQKDGVPFDIVGWDWYSTEGTNPAIRKIDGYADLNLPDYFSKMGKDFWIAEMNLDGGSADNHLQQQADWFAAFGANVKKDPQVKGVIEFMLPDMATEFQKGEKTGSLGLVPVTIDSKGVATYTTPKPAFNAYQTAISNHKFIDDYQPNMIDSAALSLTKLIDKK